VWERGTLRHTRYWSAPDREALATRAADIDPVRDFRARLEAAVQLQMVSDVPFGAFLSGGLDSSTIVALMSRHNPQVMTFSVGFHDGAYSELPHAAEVARHFDTRHHELLVSHEDIMQRLPSLVAMRDAPVSEPSDVAIHILAREAVRSVKMVLTGEGSDELLGGYPKHVAERMVGGFQMLPRAVRHELLAPLVQALPYRFRRAKTMLANLNIENWPERQARWFGALGHAELGELTGRKPGTASRSDKPPFDPHPDASALRRILYHDQTSWLPDNLLERADRMTMAASLESRVPFLDHKLAEFVSTLPDRYRVRGLTGKWILRAAAATLLPQRILKRPKVGFRVPVNDWFRGPLQAYLREHLQGARSLTRAYFDGRRLDAIVDQHTSGRHNHEKLLWTLLNLEIWHRQYARAA